MPTLRARIYQGVPAAVLLALTATSGAAGIERPVEYQDAYVDMVRSRMPGVVGVAAE